MMATTDVSPPRISDPMRAKSWIRRNRLRAHHECEDTQKGRAASITPSISKTLAKFTKSIAKCREEHPPLTDG